MLFQFQGSSYPSEAKNNRIQSVLRGRYLTARLRDEFLHSLGQDRKFARASAVEFPPCNGAPARRAGRILLDIVVRPLAFMMGLLIAPSLTALTLLVTRRAPARHATEAFTWMSTCVLTRHRCRHGGRRPAVEASGAWAAFAVAAAACPFATLLSLSLRIKPQK